MYVDNCSAHNQTEALADPLEDINTELRNFPPNATHLIQPADSFLIQKIKQARAVRWEKFKLEQIRAKNWSDGSGKIKIPGKKFFLLLAKQAVQDVNNQRDADGITYARKAMIR